MIKIFGFFIFLGLFSSFCGRSGNRAPENSAPKFGEKVRFLEGTPIYFEDFSLTYGGKRRVIADLPRQANGAFPSREFVYYDFKVKTGKQEKTVTWSSGTGDIAPTAFEIGGNKYDLELRMSDKLGKLAEDELVVWQR